MTTTTNPAEAITSALGEHPESSAAELAEVAGIGRSTANNFLAALERAGKVVRRPGGHEGGRRVSDRWSLATEASSGDSGGDAAPTEGAVAATTPPNAETSSPSADATDNDAEAPSASRLGRGELSGLVLDYLTEHRGDAIGPSAIAKALDRSSGAVGNACERLTAAGTLRRTSDAPRRYAVAS